MKQSTSNFLRFLNSTPTPYHVASVVSNHFDKAGAVKIDLQDINKSLVPGKLYYAQLSKSALVAFVAGNDISEGVRIGASHMDYPVLKIKVDGLKKDLETERIRVEGYGGLVKHTWIDRPLKFAGLVIYYVEGKQKSILISSDKTFVIPGLAIHQMPEINDNAKFSLQNDMLPFICAGGANKSSEGFEKYLIKLVAKASGDKASSISIASFDLSFTDAEDACLTGLNDEYISSPGLDDKAMVHSLMEGITLAQSEISSGYKIRPAIALFTDSEEIGSQTFSGAKSVLFVAAVKSIVAAAMGKDTLTDAEFYSCMQKTFALSADMAHATHPSFVSRSDFNHTVFLGKGTVLKTAWSQSYSTSAEGSALFSHICKTNDIPFQYFTNNSDVRGGGTIGPMLASTFGLVSIDIGDPMLSMHSARELASVYDHECSTKIFKTFFSIK